MHLSLDPLKDFNFDALNADEARRLSAKACEHLMERRDKLFYALLQLLSYQANAGHTSVCISKDALWPEASSAFPKEIYRSGIPGVVIASIRAELLRRGFTVLDAPCPADSENAPRFNLGLTISW